jgi:hypothetical protein
MIILPQQGRGLLCQLLQQRPRAKNSLVLADLVAVACRDKLVEGSCGALDSSGEIVLKLPDR